MIRTVTLNPAIDKTIQVPNFTLDAVNRVTELRADAGGTCRNKNGGSEGRKQRSSCGRGKEGRSGRRKL